jgi:hypothetical protein
MTMNLGRPETTAPHHNSGLDDQIPSSRSGVVCLDIPFYRTVFSATGISGRVSFREQHFSGSIPQTILSVAGFIT